MTYTREEAVNMAAYADRKAKEYRLWPATRSAYTEIMFAALAVQDSIDGEDMGDDPHGELQRLVETFGSDTIYQGFKA